MHRLQQQVPKIEELGPYYFSSEYWRNGCLIDLGIYTRTESIKQNRNIIREYAIGYLIGTKLWIRPKIDTVAVMFWFNDNHFWTHLTIKEFLICFPKYHNNLNE
jgi:hypothetical protein